MKRFFLRALAALCGTALQAQKPLDHDVYDGWQSVAAVQLSPDGRLLSYEIRPQEGDGTLYVRDLSNGAEISVPRGTALKTAQDAAWGIFTVKAPFADTRQGKIDKKKKDEMPKDSLALIDLHNLTWSMVSASGATDIGHTANPYVYIEQEAKGREHKDLLVVEAATGRVDTLRNVAEFEASCSGESLVVVTGEEPKDSLSRNAVILYDFAAARIDTLSAGRTEYCEAHFDASGDKLLFLATDDEEDEDGTPRYALNLTQRTVVRKATRRSPAVTEWRTCELLAADCADLPEGWVVGPDSEPEFSNRASRVVLKLQEYFPAKDTTVYSFEAAQLDIWVWDKHTVPPMDKVSKSRDQRTAVVNLDRPGQLLVLSQNAADRITLPAGAEGDFAFSYDTDKYVIDNMWEEDTRADVSLVSLRDGSRRLLKEGLHGTVAPSPYGRYIAWFNPQDGNWYSWNPVTDALVNLTGPTGVNFWDEEDDHPLGVYTPVGRPQWGGEDEYLLITDRYDVWKFRPDGKGTVCLTRGAGRRDKVRYRPVLLGTEDNPYLYRDIHTYPAKGRIRLTSFNELDKRNGYAGVDVVKGGEPQGFLAEKSFSSVTKAADADVIAYLKGDFRHPNDLYLTRDDWASESKLTAINPQQADYRWGEVQLVHWQAYDGTPLDGLLYTPDGLDKSKKYPMMIYFYEKYSAELYNYRAPAPSRSTVNIPFYVSRGYVVFIPDIVYQDGHPGESAYNCVCAGAEAMCSQFPFIDKSRMAIQGQSWGGYQTAYLITRTDMFAAAGAGAPVGNMTSAYGGIRWESGSSRIPQYEHGQSRIGKTLWEEGGLDLYIENSPVFHAPNVTTPVLIMHNDNDGAVPWYQGIEFFMSLRRLGKPAWLLEYNNEAHNLSERRNSKDLSIRLQQFFDHYLLGAPEPVWMKDGIPYERKGNYFATEY